MEKKGYIVEAATILLNNRHKLGIKDVCAITSTANLGSQNVLYKLGFTEPNSPTLAARKQFLAGTHQTVELVGS